MELINIEELSRDESGRGSNDHRAWRSYTIRLYAVFSLKTPLRLLDVDLIESQFSVELIESISDHVNPDVIVSIDDIQFDTEIDTEAENNLVTKVTEAAKAWAESKGYEWEVRGEEQIVGYHHEWRDDTPGGQTTHCWQVDERDWEEFKEKSGSVRANAEHIRSRRLIYHPEDKDE